MKNFMLVAFGIAVLLSNSANAAIELDNWSLDLSGSTYTGAGKEFVAGPTFGPIDEIQFSAKNHSKLTVDNGAAGPSAGDIYTINILGNATGLLNDGSAIFDTKLNTAGAGGWQLTFDATIDVVLTSAGPGGLEWSHLAAGAGPSDGLIDFYVDGVDNGLTPASPAAGQPSYIDGTALASFSVTSDGVGNLLGASLLGSDASTFELIAGTLAAGVLFEEGGGDLSTLPASQVLLGLVRADIDATNGGGLDVPGASPWASASPTIPVDGSGNSITEFFADEDGSFALGVTPEPTSLLVWGGLLTVAGTLRRKSKA